MLNHGKCVLTSCHVLFPATFVSLGSAGSQAIMFLFRKLLKVTPETPETPEKCENFGQGKHSGDGIGSFCCNHGLKL